MAYNQNIVDQAKLIELGLEGFDILEKEFFGKKRQPAIAPPPKPKKAPANNYGWPVIPQTNACIYQYQPQQTLVYQVTNPVSATEEMINSHGAMKLNDGLLVMEYSKRKSTARAY